MEGCPLSDQDKAILRLLADGEHVKQIARTLNTTAHGITWSVRCMKSITGARKDTQLVATALRCGWIP